MLDTVHPPQPAPVSLDPRAPAFLKLGEYLTNKYQIKSKICQLLQKDRGKFMALTLVIKGSWFIFSISLPVKAGDIEWVQI